MLLVFAPLDLAEPDCARVEAIRARHDPQASLIAAHFTLVFPFEGGDATEVASHAAPIAAATPPIGFRLTAARAVRDPLAPRSHVFLLPNEGEVQIRRLHGALYAGPLARHLRADLPYHPHVTVAASPDHQAAETIAAGLDPIAIVGRLSVLHLADFDGRQVRLLNVLPLAG